MLSEKQIEKLVEFGGKEWHGYGKNRIYFDENAICRLMNITYKTSNSGWKNSIEMNGEQISGCFYRKTYGSIRNFYYDLDADECNCTRAEWTSSCDSVENKINSILEEIK